MMRPTMGGGGRVRKHSVCRQVVPLPVAVSLCVTCFMFGLFWGRTVPTTVQETVLDATMQQQQQQQEQLRQQQHRKQPHQQKPQEQLPSSPAVAPVPQQLQRKQQEQLLAPREQQQHVNLQQEAGDQQQQQQQGQSQQHEHAGAAVQVSAQKDRERQQESQQQQQQQEAQQVVEQDIHPPAQLAAAPQLQQQQQVQARDQQQTGDQQQSQHMQQHARPVRQQMQQQPGQEQQQQHTADEQQQTQQQQQDVQSAQQRNASHHQQQQQQDHLQPTQQQESVAPCEGSEQGNARQQQPAAAAAGPGAPPVAFPAEPEQQLATCLQQSGLLQPLLPTGESGNNFYTFAAYQILSWYPRIVVFPNFIDKARAQHIIRLASSRLVKSDVELGHGERASKAASQHSSAGVFVRCEDDAGGMLGWLQDKIEAVTLTPASHGEAFYVTRYRQHDEYDPHMDVYDPAEDGPQQTTRMATMSVYLSDVDEGGETALAREGRDGGKRAVADSAPCSKHDFKYKPRAGDALLLYSLNHDNSIDTGALHSACPVAQGTKWVVTKWLHNRPLQVNASGWQ